MKSIKINLRTTSKIRDQIDYSAYVLGISRSEFIRSSAIRSAKEILMKDIKIFSNIEE